MTDPDSQMRLAVARSYMDMVGLNDSLLVVQQGSVANTLHEVGLNDIRQFIPDADVGDQIDIVSIPGEDGLFYQQAQLLDKRLGSDTRLQEGSIGIVLGLANNRIEKYRASLPEALGQAARMTVQLPVLVFNVVAGWAIGSDHPQLASTEGAPVVGPLGMAEYTSEIITAEGVGVGNRVSTLLLWAGILSYSLGMMNILPIPGLDGGRLMIVLVEIARGGKRIKPEIEWRIHAAGFTLLIGLMALVTFMDIKRLIGF